jgi:hypothetical protein
MVKMKDENIIPNEMIFFYPFLFVNDYHHTAQVLHLLLSSHDISFRLVVYPNSPITLIITVTVSPAVIY